ncbi:hypothetical protein [Pseudoroseicyclus tamaricis]|uniref:Galactose mutarotase-like enzyme n=1 Tax=Pseudoroseicyclus tamaricis TaxID=2705421 RepID=A0A6B2JMY3_9RHOB|nr:hypothetical protein [Pseudoroseicyclus tamaricis]NDU99367.1 hypothetical protein [Pseudoroseicyclus tamaricis]
MTGEGRTGELRALAWSHGVLSVQSFGAMLGPTSFVLPGGRQVSPFWIAPWAGEELPAEVDAMTAALRGEWPCVPFGYPFPAEDFPDRWDRAVEEGARRGPVHGYGSNAHWRFDPPRDDRIALQIDYPADDPVRTLRRTVTPVPGEAAIDFTLVIEARRACRLPVALHGCFALPRATGMARLQVPRFQTGRTHPGKVEPGAALYAQDSAFTDLASVPTRDGGSVDATRLPFDHGVEELLQLDHPDGPLHLVNEAEGYRVTFDWDRAMLPSVVLWYSNRGRTHAPWTGRNLVLGIEPACTAFGLSPETSCGDNPINRAGTPTALELPAGDSVTIRYRIGVSDADGSR